MDDLVQYRLDSAEEKLKSAKLLFDAGQYKDSIGRSYYAIFSAIRALLASKKEDYSKHSGVISFFQREYIKTGILDVKYSKYLQTAFQIRNSCDYDDFFLISRLDAEKQYERAAELTSAIKAYLEKEASLK